MAWIRSDCAKLSDDWLLDLDGDEYKAFDLFLHRVKAEGARGSVAVTSVATLGRQWNVPAEKVRSMLDKAATPNGKGIPRIYEDGGRWYVANWAKFQEDHKGKTARGEKGEKTEDAVNGTTTTTTLPLPPPLPLPSQKTTAKLSRQKAATVEELLKADEVYRLHDEEFALLVEYVKKICASARFTWDPTTGSIETDLRSLIYKWNDAERERIMREVQNAYGGRFNWAALIVDGVRYAIRASKRIRISSPYGFIRKAFVEKPSEILTAREDRPMELVINKLIKNRASP